MIVIRFINILKLNCFLHKRKINSIFYFDIVLIFIFHTFDFINKLYFSNKIYSLLMTNLEFSK